MKAIFLPFAIGFALFCPKTTAQTLQTSADSTSPKLSPNYTVGLTVAGTHSLPGLDFAMRVGRKFDARLGYHYFDYNYKKEDYKIRESSEQLYDFDLKAAFSHASFLFDYFPGKHQQFRVTAGVGYFFKNDLSGGFKFANDVTLNDLTLSPDEVADGTFRMFYKSKIAPYLGITLGRVIPARRVSFSMDLGAFYKGSPKVDINGTGLLSENYRNEPIVERNLKSNRFWPVAAFRLGFKLI